MSLTAGPLEILHYPAPVLTLECRPVEDIDDELRRIAGRMFELMYEHRGVGLAGPQVGVDRRIVTLNMSSEKGSGEEIVLINPEITATEGDETAEEGCLSFPGIKAKVVRPAKLVAAFTDLDGNRRQCTAEGFLARAIQHECDHLDGILFTKRMSTTQRFLVKGQLKDLEREYKKGHGA